jgi:hypothetical protein
MKVRCSSEMSAEFHRTTRYYIPEDRSLCNHLHENLKFYKHFYDRKPPVKCEICPGIRNSVGIHILTATVSVFL